MKKNYMFCQITQEYLDNLENKLNSKYCSYFLEPKSD